MNRVRSTESGKLAGEGRANRSFQGGTKCIDARKPSVAGAAIRLRRSVAVLRKPGTWSMWTEMCQKRCRRQKHDRTWQRPRVMEMPFHDAESHDALSHFKEKWTGE